MSGIISQNEKNFTLEALLNQQRLDGRKLLDHRSIKVVFGTQPGVVELMIGETHVVSKTTAEIKEPNPMRATEGFLNFKVDLSLLQEDHNLGQSHAKKLSNEISKLLEKIIKGSKAIDVESLCLISGKKVWSIEVDSMCINNQGNLIDTLYLSAIISLLHFRKPQISIEPNNQVKVYSAAEKRYQPLSIHHIPLAFTFCLFQNSQIIVMDPLKIEEYIMDGRITIAMNIYKDICSIHKPGGAPMNPSLISELIDVCSIKVVQMTKFIREVLKESDKYSLAIVKDKTRIVVMDFQTLQSPHHLNQEEPKNAQKEPLQEAAVQKNDDIDLEELKAELGKRMEGQE